MLYRNINFQLNTLQHTKRQYGTDTDYILKNNIKKNIWFVLHFTINDFYDLESFVKSFRENLKLNNQYSLVCRISYMNEKSNNATEYKMLGEQIGLFKSTHDDMYNWVLSYHDIIMSRLEESMDNYDFGKYDILDLQFICFTYQTETKQKIEKFKVDTLGLQKELINIDKTVKSFNQLLPLSFDTSTFGVLLSTTTVEGNIKSITLLNGTTINIVDFINDNLAIDKKITSIKDNTLFYQGTLRDKVIIIMVEPNNLSNKIKIYNLNGMLINTVYDTKLSDNSFTRQIGNVKSYINDKGIYRKDIIIEFSSVYASPHKDRHQRLLQPEWKIGTLDIETYVDDNTSKVYAIGYYVKNNVNTFYINENLNSDSIIIECLESMLSNKYNGYTFYVHNLSKFDIYYLLPVLEKFNDLYPGRYNYKLLFRDNSILGINISTKINNKTITIRILDSYAMLQSSLHDLCKTFNASVSKSYFPYNFITKHNLFYRGPKPSIEYYNSIPLEEYNLITNNWSTRSETIAYLEKDLVSLFEVINTFKNTIYSKYHTHITNSLTISSLTMDIYLRRYYDNKNIPLIKQKSIYNDIKQSYYGGITEVYIPTGENLFYYDVNSLYPYAALNTMPGLQCIYTDIIDQSFDVIKDDLFGFYYCKITTNKDYVGLLPYRIKEGLIMPWGTFEGWYFSEELRFAYEKGYSIHVIKGYTFSKSDNVFTKYIDELYTIKRTTKDKIIKSISKSFLNNLIGRWGLDINKYITKLVTKDEFDFIMISRKIRNFQFIGEKVLVTFDRDISKSICESHNLDYVKVYNDSIKNLNYEKDSYNDVSVAIASAITSYARIYMNKIKLDILNKGGKIYYTDTDSIVTNIKLDSSLVSDDIGKFKLEYEIKEGYFISNKTYAIKTTDDKIILKNKGIYNNSLTFEDFKKLYLGECVNGVRYESVKDYSKGVLINVPKTIKLSPYSYTKRIKLYLNNRWIDTKPVTINSYSTLSINITKKNEFIAKLFTYLYSLFVYSCSLLSIFIHNTDLISEDLLLFNTNDEIDTSFNISIDNNINLIDNITDNYEADLFSVTEPLVDINEDQSLLKQFFTKCYSLFDKNTKFMRLNDFYHTTLFNEVSTKDYTDNKMVTKITSNVEHINTIKSPDNPYFERIVYDQVHGYIVEIEELKKKIISLEKTDTNWRELINDILEDIEIMRQQIKSAESVPKIKTPILGITEFKNYLSPEGTQGRSTPRSSPLVTYSPRSSPLVTYSPRFSPMIKFPPKTLV